MKSVQLASNAMVSSIRGTQGDSDLKSYKMFLTKRPLAMSFTPAVAES